MTTTQPTTGNETMEVTINNETHTLKVTPSEFHSDIESQVVEFADKTTRRQHEWCQPVSTAGSLRFESFDGTVKVTAT